MQMPNKAKLLGILLFINIGYPANHVQTIEAGQMMGIASRQLNLNSPTSILLPSGCLILTTTPSNLSIWSSVPHPSLHW